MADCLNYGINPLDGIGDYPPDNRTNIEKAKDIMSMFIKEGGMKDFQAAAIAGVMRKESGLNPAAINKKEAAGNGSKYTQNGGYGAGLLQYSGIETKSQILSAAAAIGIPVGGRLIENLTFDEQIKTYIYYSYHNGKKWYNSLRRTLNLIDAVATFFCYIGAPYTSRFKDKFKDYYCNKEDALAIARKYSDYNKNTTNTYNLSLYYAKQYLDAYSGSNKYSKPLAELREQRPLENVQAAAYLIQNSNPNPSTPNNNKSFNLWTIRKIPPATGVNVGGPKHGGNIGGGQANFEQGFPK